MIYEFDPRKNDANVEKHDVPMLDALGFEWESAQVREDKRKTYAERRFEAIGLIEDRLYVLVFCHREAKLRVISLRKANLREIARDANEN